MAGLSGLTIGEYRLVEFLGAGGMGEVYRAEHVKIGRVVAIKILTQADPRAGLTARFLNEARIQAGVHHPHIVGLYDFVEHAGRPCIIMEYVDGDMLDRRLERSKGLRLAETLPLFREIVEAVAHLHKHRIVHRDIKSSNIKIDRAGSVKLLDFGIARDTHSGKITAAGSYVGTMHYSAPEVLSGAQADFRSDVWALGVLGYEMLCGRMPFEADTVGGFLRVVARPSYDRPSTINASCTVPFERIIDRCLEPQPASRYASAGALLEAIVTLDSADARASWRARLPRVAWPAVVRAYWPIMVAGTLGLTLAVWLAWPSDPIPARRGGAGEAITGGSAAAPDKREPVSPGAAVPPGASLRIVSINPMVVDKAEILEYGRVIGHTPFQQQLPLGRSYAWTLRAEGYEDTPIPFTVNETENVYYPLLKPKERTR